MAYYLDVATIINAAKRYPMMSEHQVVVVKEAQAVRNMEELFLFINNHTQRSNTDFNMLLYIISGNQIITLICFGKPSLSEKYIWQNKS